MRGVARTVSEAREVVKDEPKRWKAAILEGPETPMLDSPKTIAHLFATIKGAGEDLRERKAELEEQGFKMTLGGLGRGILRMTRGDEDVWLGLDRAGRHA